MASSNTSQALLKKSKTTVATQFRDEFSRPNSSTQKLHDFLDYILDPTKKIDEDERVEWCRCLIAGGSTFGEFSRTVRQYDNAVTCGLVWTSNFVAYRCRTCGISPCMSLCSECFQAGNHEGHDYNMFKSHAGGACDCGDVNVMHSQGFCPRHGPERKTSAMKPPTDLLYMAKIMLPRLLMRLVYHLRSDSSAAAYADVMMHDCEKFVSFLHALADMGAAMRDVIAKALTDPEVYEQMTKVTDKMEGTFFAESQKCYKTVISSLSPYPQGFERYNKPGLDQNLVHKTLLEELIFWIVRYRFPTAINTLLLKMLPDDDYRVAFAKAYVHHYSRTALVLCSTQDNMKVANRVVHISVQLFSSEKLAFKMVDEFNLLYTVVLCLSHMFESINIPSTMEVPESNFHNVIDCSQDIMKGHCYWSIVTDFINLLSHKRITLKFLEDEELVTLWVDMLTYLQGMNLNVREHQQHVVFEPDTYYAAFSAELEISSLPMWSILAHCKTPETASLCLRMIAACQSALQDWFEAINCMDITKPNPDQLTFHLPLHRYLATFMMQAVQHQGIELSTILPEENMLKKILIHVLQIQVCMAQIFAGIWVRNGIQIRGQAMTYIQCHFCYSMSDADIHLIQVCASKLDPDYFVRTVLERFNVLDWLSFSPTSHNNTIQLTGEQEIMMVESVLAFFSSLLGIRTYLGIEEKELVRREMIALLCMSDQQHSQLCDLMPEKSGMSGKSKELFEPTLKEVSDFKAPKFEAGGGMQQGTYILKDSLWEREYDPIKVMQRAVLKKDVQAALDRYTQHVKKNCNYKKKTAPWPPFKIPGKIHQAYKGLYNILNCRTMHAFLFIVLCKVQNSSQLPDSILQHCVHLLNMALEFAPKKNTVKKSKMGGGTVSDCQYKDWFSNTDIRHNVCESIDEVIIHTSTPTNMETEESCTMNVDMDISSLEEMFQLDASVVVDTAGPMTSAKVGQKPTITMISKPGGIGPTSFASSTRSTPDAKPKYESRGVSTTEHVQPMPYKIGESMISLLFKLCTKLSSKPSSYIPISVKQREPITSDVGDGEHFIARLLDRISGTNRDCAATINQIYSASVQKEPASFKSQKEQDEFYAKARDERRRKAFERQQRLKEQFASRQKAFLEQAMAMEDDGEGTSSNKDEDMNAAENEGFDCVICGQCTPSTAEKPIGLVVFFQASSVLGHCTKMEVKNPASVTEKRYPRLSNRGKVQRRQLEELYKDLDQSSCQMSVSIGWEGGVVVQTCGHFLHLDCHSSYIKSLKSQKNMDNLAVKNGEYWCPLCRQLSNSVIPVVPEENKHTLVKPISNDPQQMVADLAEMMVKRPITPGSEVLTKAMGNVMEDLLHTTYSQYRSSTSSASSDCVFLLFVCSVARTNLELELLQLGGQLNQAQLQNLNKKNCFLPLLNVLSLHSKIITLEPTPYINLWTHITGVNLSDVNSTCMSVYQKDVPLLLKDITSLLIQFILTLPFTIKPEHYKFVVQMLYNSLYIQALTTVICKFGAEEREAWRSKGTYSTIDTLEGMLSHLITRLNCSRLFEQEELDHSFPAICQSVWSPQSVEVSLQEHLLPFLRIAVLLKHHFFKLTLPENQNCSEFVYLCKILELGNDDSLFQREVVSSSLVNWATSEPLQLTRAWCVHYMDYVNINPGKGRSLLTINQTWYSPRLVSLPKEYYEIFQHYRNKQCCNCNKTPKDPCICLVCGDFVCFREVCCLQDKMYECVQHSITCGAGTGIFLLINSSIIVVIRGARATLWGSVYLDEHGEEDRDLKRGKPLFLSKDRYQLLEEQWLSHNFDYACKKWIWHKNSL